MKLILSILLLSTSYLLAYEYNISPIDPYIEKRMKKGNSWKKNCPVGLSDLRYLRLAYIDYNGRDRKGEMIVHKSVSQEVVSIFRELYTVGYPIYKMELVSNYKGSDWQSIEADNSSAFNCRKATGSGKWSKHAYGKAIDINPIENPYISSSGRIAHKASQKYRQRVHHNRDNPSDRAVLLKYDEATQIFKRHGWRWGGDWSRTKDYQHFYK